MRAFDGCRPQRLGVVGLGFGRLASCGRSWDDYRLTDEAMRIYLRHVDADDAIALIAARGNEEPRGPGGAPWTDNYSNLFDVLNVRWQ